MANAFVRKATNTVWFAWNFTPVDEHCTVAVNTNTVPHVILTGLASLLPTHCTILLCRYIVLMVFCPNLHGEDYFVCVQRQGNFCLPMFLDELYNVHHRGRALRQCSQDKMRNFIPHCFQHQPRLPWAACVHNDMTLLSVSSCSTRLKTKREVGTSRCGGLLGATISRWSTPEF